MRSTGEDPAHEQQSLDGLLRDIDEEIEEQELVQYVTGGPARRTLWGLLILTASSLHVVYGEGTNWLGRILRTGTIGHRRISVRFDEIERVDLPPRGGIVRRLIQGPTRTALIVTANGEPLELEVDDSAARLVEIARSRAVEPA